MAMTLPQAIFAYQVRKTAQDLGAIGTIAGIAFTYFQTRRPKLAFAVGLGMIGYFAYQHWLDSQKPEQPSDAAREDSADADAQPDLPTPSAPAASPALT